MEWNKGFSATYYAAVVDPATWRDTERFEIISGSIARAESSLIESADISTTYEFSGEKWIRVYMDVRQNGAAAHVALFTGLATPPQTDYNGLLKSFTLECYSVLKPAEDVLLERGYFIPEEGNSAEFLKRLLEVIPAPVEIEDNAPTLMNSIIAESGESHLSMVLKILKAINWRIRLSGDGTVRICPKASAPEIRFDALDNDSIEPKITLTRDWFNCPNVFRAVSDDMAAVVKDDREDSSLSVQNRGREVWMEETSSNLSDGEGILAYALRRLREEQSRGYDVSYTRRFHPDITISDLVGLHYPGQGLAGAYKIISQNIRLGAGCRTEEKVEYS